MTETSYRIHGATGEWEVVVGLEVHAQITSQSKLFSGAATAFGAEPNTQVSLVDAAMPGMLPVPNRECIRQAVRTGMAIGAKINPWSRFDRKAEQPTMEPGDILLRLSSVWHRGTRNPASSARPMGMLGYRPVALGLPQLALDSGAALTIGANRYYGKYAGLREFVAIRLRPVYELARIAAARSR